MASVRTLRSPEEGVITLNTSGAQRFNPEDPSFYFSNLLAKSRRVSVMSSTLMPDYFKAHGQAMIDSFRYKCSKPDLETLIDEFIKSESYAFIKQCKGNHVPLSLYAIKVPSGDEEMEEFERNLDTDLSRSHTERRIFPLNRLLFMYAADKHFRRLSLARGTFLTSPRAVMTDEFGNVKSLLFFKREWMIGTNLLKRPYVKKMRAYSPAVMLQPGMIKARHHYMLCLARPVKS